VASGAADGGKEEIVEPDNEKQVMGLILDDEDLVDDDRSPPRPTRGASGGEAAADTLACHPDGDVEMPAGTTEVTRASPAETLEPHAELGRPPPGWMPIEHAMTLVGLAPDDPESLAIWNRLSVLTTTLPGLGRVADTDSVAEITDEDIERARASVRAAADAGRKTGWFGPRGR
jgi:hypothetical protein